MDLTYNKDRIVLGTAGLAGIWGKVDFEESIRTILMALEMGITQFDTAPAYAEAEELLATALQKWGGTKPIISTKVGKLRSYSPDTAFYDYSPATMIRSVEQSLKLFKLEALDLVFLHDPGGIGVDQIEPAIGTLVMLKQKGLIKNIGIGGNFGVEFDPFSVSGVFSHFMGYNRYNIIRQTASFKEYKRLRSSGVQIWQASPLYMGLLGNKFNAYTSEGPAWIPAEDLAKVRELKAEFDKLGYDITGVALNYVYNSPLIGRMVIGASNSLELRATLEHLENPALKEASMRHLERDGQL